MDNTREVILIGSLLRGELLKIQEMFGLKSLNDVIELLMYHFEHSKSVPFDTLMYLNVIKSEPQQNYEDEKNVMVRPVLKNGIEKMKILLRFENINDFVELLYYHFENSESFSKKTLMYLAALKDEERNIELRTMSDERFTEILKVLKS